MLDNDKTTILLARTNTYLQSTLGASFSDIQPVEPKLLPLFLTDNYALQMASLFGQRCLIVMPAAHAKITANTYEKHRSTLNKVIGAKHVVLIANHLDTRAIRRLIGRHQPFIVPDAQLYLPDFAIHFRERRARPKVSGTHLSPTAQLLVLAHLHGQDITGQTASRLGPCYRLSIMSISRAIGELVEFQLATVDQHGRENILQLPPFSHDYWTKALPFLRSPIRKTRMVAAATNLPLVLASGESALAQYTSLVDPASMTFAIADHEWKHLEPELGPEVDELLDPDAMAFETWSYDPNALSAGPAVDRLSLWLATHDHPDERVAKAAEIALKEFKF